MKFWKFIVYTSPIWVVLECSFLGVFPVPKPKVSSEPQQVEFNGYLDLCEFGDEFCLSSSSPRLAASNQDFVPWHLPDDVLNDDYRYEGFYFSVEGEYLGARRPKIDFEASQVPLKQVLLKDGRDWFEKNEATPLDDWIVKTDADGYFEHHIPFHYVVRNGELTGWLKGWGGWYAKPRPDLEIKFLDGSSCRVATFIEDGYLHVIDYYRERGLKFVLDDNVPKFVECDGPTLVLEQNGVERTVAYEDWERFGDGFVTMQRSQWTIKRRANGQNPIEYENEQGQTLKVSLPDDMDLLSVSNFSEGFAPINVRLSTGGDAYGYINETGKIEIYPIFREADGYNGGLASVIYCKGYNDCARGLITRDGDFFVHPNDFNFEFDWFFVRNHDRLEFIPLK